MKFFEPIGMNFNLKIQKLSDRSIELASQS